MNYPRQTRTDSACTTVGLATSLLKCDPFEPIGERHDCIGPESQVLDQLTDAVGQPGCAAAAKPPGGTAPNNSSCSPDWSPTPAPAATLAALRFDDLDGSVLALDQNFPIPLINAIRDYLLPTGSLPNLKSLDRRMPELDDR